MNRIPAPPHSFVPPLRPLAAGALAVLLAACASTHGLSPQAEPLDAATLDAEARAATAPSDAPATAMPAPEWWRAYGDPQLDALVDEALAGTPGLALADARVREALAQAGLAEAGRRPTAGLTARYAGLRAPETVAPEPFGGHYSGIELVGLQLSYTPDLWGGERAKEQAALGQARAAEVEAQAARLTLASNIAHAYVALAQAHAVHDLALAEKERATAQAALAGQRMRAGLDNRMPVEQAEAAVRAAEQQTTEAAQAIRSARLALAALVGQGPARAESIRRPVLLDRAPPAAPEALPSDLLAHRPDIAAARWRVEAAARGIDVAKAAFYPTINLAALIGVAATTPADLFGADAALIQGGPALSLPIFDGGRRRNELSTRNARYDQAVAQYNQALIGAARETVDTLQRLRALDTQVAQVAEARGSAERALAVARERRAAGLANRLDELNAQRPLLQLDRQLAALRAQRLDAAIDLERALGGGLDPASPSSPFVSTRTP